MMRPRTRWLTALAVIPVVVAVVGAGGGYVMLRASLARRDGAAEVQGLAARVEIELDTHAVPRVRGATLDDVSRGLGFMHAQERFFQMDLTRRSAAGELAALVGRRALARDRAQRPYEMRRRASAWLERLPAEHRGWLEAYAQGVNAGLDDLRAAPPEYLVLGERPEPWTAEDSLLVAYSLYTMLSDNESFEKPQAVMQAILPPEVFAFLTPSTTRFDRPVVYPPDDRTGGYVPMPIPDAHVLDLRERPLPVAPGIIDPPLIDTASNQWAAGASRTRKGDALLANDPHLRLVLPSTFYRAELYWPGHVVRGASIAGLPGILIGASATLAWGATASYADQSDWIVVDVDDDDATRYRSDGGWSRFTTVVHEIEVADEEEPDRLEVKTTPWGPLTDRDGLGRPLVLEATWLKDDGASLDILELMRAETVAEGLKVVGRWAGPTLNWMLADDSGAVGWAVNGPVPRRIGFDGSVPQARDTGRRWDGLAALPDVGPLSGTLFTANQRTLPRDDAAALGRAWIRPARARRIGELLDTRELFGELDFLAMQLDTSAAAYEPVRNLILEAVPAGTRETTLAWARRTAESWDGRADAQSSGFRLMHAYHRALLERVLAPLLSAVYAADPTFVYSWPLADEPLMRLLEERPEHLLTADDADWPALLEAALVEALDSLEEDGVGLEATWGRANRLNIAHPLAALPGARWFLSLPEHEQAGSLVSVRVAAPTYGAALRMAVSPADPEAGIMQMPGGQSGHFLSRNFADLHGDWADGTPTPFLAGATRSRFSLIPTP